jgi:hypothetical protein
MTRFSFSFLVRYAFLVMVALLGANLAWVVFIVVVDLFCGVRPQAAVPLFPAAFVAVILLLMIRALRRVGVTKSQSANPGQLGHTPSKEARSQEASPPGSEDEASRSGKAILRSMLIVNRRRASSASEVKGKVS